MRDVYLFYFPYFQILRPVQVLAADIPPVPGYIYQHVTCSLRETHSEKCGASILGRFYFVLSLIFAENLLCSKAKYL